ncbi:MAG: hypothetical protein AB7W59_20220 [Acidimicrobiia bacterium]
MAGSVVSAFAVGGLVLGFHEGPERGWTDPVTIAGFAVGVLAAAGFVRIELRRHHPRLDVREFARPDLATGSVNLFVAFAVMFALFGCWCSSCRGR